MATLNNNQIASILNEAIAQSMGSDEIDTLDLSGIVDRGNDVNVIGSVEQFSKALMNVLIKRWFTDSSYRSEFSSPFLQDAEKFGAIIEAISIDYPDVRNNKAWQDFSPTVDEQTGEITYVTIGTYEVHPLGVNAKHYGRSVSWSVDYSISQTQYNTAFHSESELRQFVLQMQVIVENALLFHIENMDNMNRNALIASKVSYAGTQGATGIHVINLVQAYQESLATQSDMTVDAFLNSADGLRFAAEEMAKYMSYIRKPSTMFNVAGKKRFLPKEREVVQILEAFKLRLERVSLSQTWHDEYVSLPLAESVPYWQGFGDNAKFDEVSKIDVQLVNGTDITKTGIVGLIADQWSCMHTIIGRRNVAQYFQREDIVMYDFQFSDRYMIDDTQNALVFTVEDYTAPEAGGGDEGGGDAGGGTP